MTWSVEEVAFAKLSALVSEALDSEAFLPLRGDREPFVQSLPDLFEGHPDYHLFALVGEAGERIGFAAVLPHREPGALSLGPLYVRRQDRGQGRGKRLVGAVIRWAETQGVRRLYTQTWGQNRRVRRILEELGFACVAIEPDTRVNGDSTVHYRLELPRLGAR